MIMKKLFLLVLLFAVTLFAVNEEGFVLNIFNDKYPVKEIEGKVTIPFDSEYIVFLRNSNDRDCTAKIWIDGALVSNFGDFIIEANSELNLERFVTESMQEGKRFKFVPLDNPEVDDPDRKENGIIKVEFRLEKQCMRIKPFSISPFEYYWEDGDIIIIPGDNLSVLASGTSDITITDANTTWDCSGDITVYTSCSSLGATIAGSESKQSFHYANIEVEDEPIVLTLKIMGIN